MRKSIIVLMFSVLALTGLQAQQVRNCGAMDYKAREEAQDPSIAATRARIEAFTQQYVDAHPQGGADVVYNIPVVVHVVYNTTTQNISDAQIQSQITVLNNDFRKLNADASNVPSAWTSLAADAEVNFCLATVDPNGAATTGITRTSTTVTSFTDNDAVKFSSSGGKDAWDRNKYLNLWVCNLPSLLGYAQFPGGTATTDGVVINYTAFGTSGTATAPFNKGRTGTHEVGHWLNLYHIWGDDCGQGDGVCSTGAGECGGSDAVTDTPNQCEMTYGTYAAGTVRTDGCTSTSPGVMWMNYMDYTDDGSMYMFTTGQKARMQAVLGTGGARASLAASTACGGGTPSYCSLAASNSSFEHVSRVQFGTVINNLSGNNSGYGNFTATTYNVTKGSAYTVTLTPGFASTTYSEYWKVYIDYNNDKDFIDAGENVLTLGPSTAAVSGSVTIPTTASTAAVRMRVIMSDAAIAGPCTAYTYGEVEDYTLNLQSATSCGNPSGLTAGSITSTGATLSWTAVTGATSYNIQYKTSAATTWTTTTSTTNSKALTGLSSSTLYNWQVQAVCSGGSSSYVAGANFTTLAAGCTDSYEPNETSGAAPTIAVNTNILPRICSSTDVDWFKFTTTSLAPKVKVTLTTLPLDYDVYLYNSSLVQIGAGELSGTTSESITFNTATTAATYYVKVIPYMNSGSSTQYTLRASAQAANWRVDPNYVAPVAPKDLSGISEDQLMVYPNPVSQNLFLNFITLSEGSGDVMVMDLSGRILYTNTMGLRPGSNVLDFSVADFADGMYIVRLRTASGVFNAKVQVMH